MLIWYISGARYKMIMLQVISQNQAIVETLDPFWKGRYMRQSSREGEASDATKGIEAFHWHYSLSFSHLSLISLSSFFSHFLCLYLLSFALCHALPFSLSCLFLYLYIYLTHLLSLSHHSLSLSLVNLRSTYVYIIFFTNASIGWSGHRTGRRYSQTLSSTSSVDSNQVLYLYCVCIRWYWVCQKYLLPTHSRVVWRLSLNFFYADQISFIW